MQTQPTESKWQSTRLGARVLTAGAGIGGLAAVTVWGGSRGLSYLVVAAIGLCLYEYLRLGVSRFSSTFGAGSWFLLCALILLTLMLFEGGQGALSVLLSLCIYGAGTVWLGGRRELEASNVVQLVVFGSFGLIYCVAFPTLAILILRTEAGVQWFYWTLTVVFAGDIFAYFGGILLGRKKLAKTLSPGKTWAGAISGLFGSILIGVGFSLLVFEQISIWAMVIGSGTVGCIAQMGDLLVSSLKRYSGLKDSGHLLPGHGGILDRIDGVLMAWPIVTLLTQLLSN